MNDVLPMIGGNVETWSGKTRHDENFPVGSKLIRRDLRAHVHAYYDFARNADDIADSPDLLPEDKVARLDIMEQVLLGQRPDGSPSASRLRKSLAETKVSSIHATELLIAFRRDATKRRYDTIDELYNYCRYSAVPVGRYVLDLHKESHDCYSSSDALCISLQVLNHLQDCGKDLANLDRCYLPMTLMDHFGAKIDDLRKPAETPALRRVFVTLLDRIDRLNQAAAELPSIARDRRLRMETAVICGLARRLATRLAYNDPLAMRVRLTKTDAAFSVLGAMRYLV
jgi:hydroxysqualene synthase